MCNVNLTNTILWQGHHDRVMQLNWLHFWGKCQMMPLKVWPNIALGCNHQSICMPQLQPLVNIVLITYLEYYNLVFAVFLCDNCSLTTHYKRSCFLFWFHRSAMIKWEGSSERENWTNWKFPIEIIQGSTGNSILRIDQKYRKCDIFVCFF